MNEIVLESCKCCGIKGENLFEFRGELLCEECLDDKLVHYKTKDE